MEILLSTLIILISGYTIYRLCQIFLVSSTFVPCHKYVLITGCDTGVGNALALALDQQGFHVLAGVLFEESIVQLKNKLSLRASVFIMDITKDVDINNAYEFIKNRTDSLYGLVNNAGIITHGCIDWMSMTMMRKLMEVNFFGQVMVTKTFLPLLIRKRNSRVVNVISAAGFYTFPNTSAYSASKHALKSFTDCLRREMAPWQCHVSSIEPGALRTTMLDSYESTLRNIWNGLSMDLQKRWGVNYLNDMIDKAIHSPFLLHADDPMKVVRAINHALTSKHPHLHYRPGWQGKLIFYVLYLLPTRLSDRIIAQGFNFVPSGIKDQLAT